METDNHQKSQAIILFDGVCNFCNSSVNLVMKNDPEGYFKFAPLQGEAAITLLKKFSSLQDPLKSVILVENDRVFTQSEAAIRIALKMRGVWKLFGIFLLVPTFIRNPVYRFIAQNRYKWFGKRESCRIPTAAEKARFL